MVLSRVAREIQASATLAITAKAKQLAAEGKDVIGFGAGEPDFDTPENIKNAAIKAIKNGFTKYTPTSGVPKLKEAICEKLFNDNHLKYASSQILVSAGAKQSICNIALVLCDTGDEAIIPSPYWVSYPEMVTLAGQSPFSWKRLTKIVLRLRRNPWRRLLRPNRNYFF